MRRVSAFAFASAIVALAAQARPEPAPVAPLPAFLQILGSVTNAARPVGSALVIALNLNNLDATQTYSGGDGSFTLPQLPAGVYKVIAVKYGFAPAMAMIVPTKQQHRIKLRLETDKQAKRNVSQEMWEIRGSLPPDVLRELDHVMEPPTQVAMASAASPSSYEMPRFRGEMRSMTGVSAQADNSSFASTALGVDTRLGDRWQLGFRGNLHRVDNPSDDTRFGTPVAQSSAMSMELRSSPTDSVRIASTKAWWLFRDGSDPEQAADVRSHNIEWEHGDAHVGVRYLAQQHMFVANPGSDLIEVTGNTTLMQTRRSDVGVTLRVSQESLRSTPATVASTFRTADFTATGKYEVVPSLVVNYGMSSRIGLYGTEWAPRTGAMVKVGKDTALIFSGMVKMIEQTRTNVLPSIVVWNDESRVLPRYAYSAGFISGDPQHDHFSAVGTISAADAPLRVIFTDGFEHFWDGLYVDAGDRRRDLRLAYHKELGRFVMLDVATSAGSASQTHLLSRPTDKSYVTGDVESTFHPTGTTLAVSYRQIHQPQPSGAGSEYRTERMNVRVAQALHLPLDLKLLLGMEVGHAVNSPVLLDTFDPDGTTKRYIGGLSVNF
jgi:hypothetical protein